MQPYAVYAVLAEIVVNANVDKYGINSNIVTPDFGLFAPFIAMTTTNNYSTAQRPR